jgi:hypothetical protein
MVLDGKRAGHDECAIDHDGAAGVNLRTTEANVEKY